MQRQLASALEIDTPMYSRIERGERPASREQVKTLARILNIPTQTLLNLWLAEKVCKVIKEEKYPQEVLDIVAENIFTYHKTLGK
ncbi:MAG: helix-turn-helix transcriptional regulator [Lachnospiraceae bacterium]|nr:helix-turn-helix transcriptional regulator [Lachnospiraceae bacterium]